MLDREDLRNGAAGRMSNDMATLDLEPVQQSDHVGRHPLDRVADPALVALTDAAMVEGDDLEPLTEGCDLVLPERCETTKSRYEHDGKAHAVPLVIERAVAD